MDPNISAHAEYTWQKTASWQAFCIMFWSWLMVCTVVGNLLVIICVCRTKKCHTSIYTFYASLALADLIVGAFCAPLLLTVPFFQEWILGNAMCHAFSVGISTSLNASVATLCLISLDRLNAVIKPLQYRGHMTFTQRWKKRLVVFAWVHSVFWASTPLFGWGEIIVDSETQTCKPNWSPDKFSDKMYAFGLAGFAFTVPTVIMVIVYCVIYWTSKRSGKWLRERSQSTVAIEMARQKKQRGILKTVLAIIGAFALCWTTYTIGTTFKLFANSSPPAWLVHLGLMLAAMNSSVNPAIYAALDKDLKEQFRRLLRCCATKDAADLNGPASRKTSAASLSLQVNMRTDVSNTRRPLPKIRITYV